MPILPEVDLNKCSGKGDCAHVCIRNVLRVKTITADDYRQLSFKGKLKTIFSNGKKATVVKSEACINCGKCVAACRVEAIKLVEMW